MIIRFANKLKKLYDNHIAQHAQVMLDKHLQKVDTEERPYVQSRIGFGASLRKKEG